jgi:hypothetical protein
MRVISGMAVRFSFRPVIAGDIDMPFDGTDFPERGRRIPSAKGEKLLRIVFVAAAIGLLIMPISLGGLTDIVRYFQRH